MPLQPAITGSRTFQGPGAGGGLPDWVDFTPEWIIAGGTPYTDGNCFGQYLIQENPDGSHTVDVAILVAPVVATLPAGVWGFVLPFSPAWNSLAVGSAWNFKFPLPTYFIGVACSVRTDYVEVYNPDGSQVDETHPFTWTTGSSLYLSLRYHAV